MKFICSLNIGLFLLITILNKLHYLEQRLLTELPATANTSSWLYVFLFSTVVQLWTSNFYMWIIYRLRLHDIQITWHEWFREELFW